MIVYQFDENWNGQTVAELVDWNHPTIFAVIYILRQDGLESSFEEQGPLVFCHALLLLQGATVYTVSRFNISPISR